MAKENWLYSVNVQGKSVLWLPGLSKYREGPIWPMSDKWHGFSAHGHLELQRLDIENSPFYIVLVETKINHREQIILSLNTTALVQIIHIKGGAKLSSIGLPFLNCLATQSNLFFWNKGDIVLEPNVNQLNLVMLLIVDRLYLDDLRPFYTETIKRIEKHIQTKTNFALFRQFQFMDEQMMGMMAFLLESIGVQNKLDYLQASLSVQSLIALTIASRKSLMLEAKDHLQLRQDIRLLAKEIAENMDEFMGLKAMAKRLGTNQFLLKVLFKEVMGMPPYHYWQTQRMLKARKWLLVKEKSPTDIAYTLGFSSIQSLSRAFKKFFGIPPSKMK